MKQLTIVLVAGAVCMAIGCEKRAGQSAEVDRYSTGIDGPACILTVRVDENLLSDQKELARQAKLSRAAAENEGRTADEYTSREDTTPAPAAGPAEAVRQVMVDLIANFKAGNMDRLTDALPSTEASELRKFFNGFDKLNQKKESIVQLFKTKLKMEPPPDVKEAHSTESFIYAIFGVNFSQVSLDDLDIRQAGETVVVTGPSIRKVTFSKVEQGWKIQLNPDARQLTRLLDDVVVISEKIDNDFISGINSGAFTKDNHRARMDEIEQRHGAVMGAKIGALMKKLLIPWWKKPAPVSAPKPESGRINRPRRPSSSPERRRFER